MYVTADGGKPVAATVDHAQRQSAETTLREAFSGALGTAIQAQSSQIGAAAPMADPNAAAGAKTPEGTSPSTEEAASSGTDVQPQTAGDPGEMTVDVSLSFRPMFGTIWAGYTVKITFRIEETLDTPDTSDPSPASNALTPSLADTLGRDASVLGGIQGVIDAISADPIPISGADGQPDVGSAMIDMVQVAPIGVTAGGEHPSPDDGSGVSVEIDQISFETSQSGEVVRVMEVTVETQVGVWLPVGPMSFVTRADRDIGNEDWRRWNFGANGRKDDGGSEDYYAEMPLDLRLSLQRAG